MRTWQLGLIMVVAVAVVVGLIAGTASTQSTPPAQLKMDDLSGKKTVEQPTGDFNVPELTERRVPVARIEYDALVKRVVKLEAEVQELKKQVTILTPAAPKPAEKAAKSAGGK